jgi:hypothetical protein
MYCIPLTQLQCIRHTYRQIPLGRHNVNEREPCKWNLESISFEILVTKHDYMNFLSTLSNLQEITQNSIIALALPKHSFIPYYKLLTCTDILYEMDTSVIWDVSKILFCSFPIWNNKIVVILFIVKSPENVWRMSVKIAATYGINIIQMRKITRNTKLQNLGGFMFICPNS